MIKLQRRTFLGGLLAAVATSTAYGRMALEPARIEVAEQKLRELIPEPEEGYRLIVNPGYELPQMKAICVDAIANEIPAQPEFTIHMTRPDFFSNEWNGTIKPVQYDLYRRCSLKMQVEGDDVVTAHQWINRMMDAFRGNYLSERKANYGGTGTFGQEGKDPLIKLEGLYPTSVNTEWDGRNQIATVEMSFDWVHQNVL
jgi:hypothetical protein